MELRWGKELGLIGEIIPDVLFRQALRSRQDGIALVCADTTIAKTPQLC